MVVAYLSLNKRLNPFDEDFNRAALFFENFYRRIFWNSGKMCLKCGEKTNHSSAIHHYCITQEIAKLDFAASVFLERSSNSNSYEKKLVSGLHNRVYPDIKILAFFHGVLWPRDIAS